MKRDEDYYRNCYKHLHFELDNYIFRSQAFKIVKWMFTVITILILIALFGGSIYTSNKINSLIETVNQAKKEVSDKKEKTIHTISVEQEKFKSFIKENNYRVAKEKFDNLITNVEHCANDAIKYINLKKEEATEKLDVSNIKDLNNTKLEIKILEDKIKKLNNNKIISMEKYIYITLGISIVTFILFIVTLFFIKKDNKFEERNKYP